MNEPRRPQSPGRRSDDPGDLGRVITQGFIASGWHCRWCGRELIQDGYAVVCPECDRAEHVTA